MSSITENFRRHIAAAEKVLPFGGDIPQVRIRLDFLKELLDEIDAEHERRMEQQSRDLLKAHMRYIAGVVEDYKHGIKRKRKEQE